MNIRPALVYCVMFLSVAIFCSLPAMGRGHKKHDEKKGAALKTLETEYDIKHLRFNLHVTDTSVYLSGDVATTARVAAKSMEAYVFELGTTLTIDSAKINGVPYQVSGSGPFRAIILPQPLLQNSFFTAQVFYHGSAPDGEGFFNGLTHSVSSGGTPMTYSVSDPWAASDWWPAKQDANDKIDSLDMLVTVPRGVVDGSNGLLIGVDSTTTPGYWTYHWQSHYPIDYYLISIAVARYAVYRSYMHFTGSTDSMLIENFFLDTATFNPQYKAYFDSIGMIINFYSSLFGRYPFWKEKYGVCYTTLPGGMEHQTMTTIGTPNITIIAHELMHQWFGDNVTYATWGEMWLSEGFASFSEQLFLARFHGRDAAKKQRALYLNDALSQPCGELFVTDTSGPNTLFFQPTVYEKGQAVVTMLRCLAPSDSDFFGALRAYQRTYAYGNATVADLNAIFDSVYGYNIDSFFIQWTYGYGYPLLTVSWNQLGPTVFVKLIQSPSCAINPTHFTTPVELQLHSASADTIVWAYNTADTQVFEFESKYEIDAVNLNPDALTMCHLKNDIVHDRALNATSCAAFKKGRPIKKTGRVKNASGY